MWEAVDYFPLKKAEKLFCVQFDRKRFFFINVKIMEWQITKELNPFIRFYGIYIESFCRRFVILYYYVNV